MNLTLSRINQLIPVRGRSSNPFIDINTSFVNNKSEASNYKCSNPSEERKKEIKSFNQQLRNYGLTYPELVAGMPRDKLHKKLAIELAKSISSNDIKRNDFLKSRQLPIENLVEEVQVTDKFIKTYQSYIVGMSLLLIGDYEHLHSFMMGGLLN